MKVDGVQRCSRSEITLDKKFKHTIEVVVDRLTMKPDLRTRLAQSVETAAQLADGLVAIDIVDEDRSLLFSEQLRLPGPRRLAARAAAAHLLVQLARTARARAAPGSGRSRRSTRTCSSPDPSLSISEGALVPWSVGTRVSTSR